MAKLLPLEVEIWHQGHVVARRERCYDRSESIYDLEHYLDVWVRKPGAGRLDTARAMARERSLLSAHDTVGVSRGSALQNEKLRPAVSDKSFTISSNSLGS
jgi:hypothetical protein